MRLLSTTAEGPDRPGRRLIAIIGAALALLAFAAAPSSLSAGDDTQAEHPPRLDSRLTQVLDAYERGGSGEAITVAGGFGIDADGDRLRLIVVASPGRREAATAVAKGLGAAIERSHGELAQVLVPLGALEALSRSGSVDFVRPPLEAVPFETSQGVALTNADDWHALGVTGAGVKVAVLDLGFMGYTDRLGTELPATVTAQSFRDDGDISAGIQHGTAVAEIVYDMAPGAQMYLANFDTELELEDASQWLTEQGVQVINASWGYFTAGPGDGTGFVNDVVTQSEAAGALWSVAAGNHAFGHWSGQFRDANNNTWHEFTTAATPDEGNQLAGSFFGLLFAGETAVGELKWDDPFGAACRDYDLYLKRTDDSNPPVNITVAFSETRQYDNGCVPGANPIETFSVNVLVTDYYHLTIQEHAAATDANMHLYSIAHDLEYAVTASSLAQPADNPNAMTMGAVYWNSPNTIETFSSRGPTTDGRTKPDLVGPDGVSTATYGAGAFFGTSAAAPHGTGAGALTKQRLPCYTPAQLKAFLETQVVDLGPAGKDNTYGSGRLSLGAVPLDTDADGVGNACDADDDSDAWSDAAEAVIGTDPLLKCGANAWPPDFNNDASVTGADLSAVASQVGKAVPPAPARSDIGPDPPDGSITGADLSALAGKIGGACSP